MNLFWAAAAGSLAGLVGSFLGAFITSSLTGRRKP